MTAAKINKSKTKRERRNSVFTLTLSEFDCNQLVSQGFTPVEIATILEMSRRRVKHYLKEGYDKLHTAALFQYVGEVYGVSSLETARHPGTRMEGTK